ncbi:hypothetical protein DR_2530 [Deinococcus radiodurans R1 = ATCC 13939 = DSM 20539]|uniref:Uncharacterized protein n=1 Tax=Deinococcus radiodurans (strain ATCC 13939 / DSM 20539 / JCM 16871 / CCUG 27074 / LMG 4051 / NBRC 15346 / NCIMB 9279 / VKM B-1422 / R1) TaxID=243230 RepID=Q9RRG2_DEIRA|nr:hypothetical protein DR_2530 [Deinococcus radiodurans R1 = ATCC 13939 = DSM 20539]
MFMTFCTPPTLPPTRRVTCCTMSSAWVPSRAGASSSPARCRSSAPLDVFRASCTEPKRGRLLTASPICERPSGVWAWAASASSCSGSPRLSARWVRVGSSPATCPS